MAVADAMGAPLAHRPRDTDGAGGVPHIAMTRPPSGQASTTAFRARASETASHVAAHSTARASTTACARPPQTRQERDDLTLASDSCWYDRRAQRHLIAGSRGWYRRPWFSELK